MQKLKAVNYLMNLMGASPVGSLTSLHPDSQTALDRLDEAIEEIQKEGWWFNTEYKYTLVPDAAGDINLPLNTLEANVTSRNAVVKRGDKLYDTVNHTYNFTEPLTVNLILQLDWDLLDLAAQQTMKFFAAAMLCEVDIEDNIKAARQEKYYTKALADMRKTDLRVQRRNAINSPASRILRNGIRPIRNSGIDPTFPGGS